MEALLFILLITSLHAVFPKAGQEVNKGAGLYFYSEAFKNRLFPKAYKILFAGNLFFRFTGSDISPGHQNIFSPIGAAVVAERNDFYIFKIWQGRKKKHKHLFLTFGNPNLINST